MTKTETKPELKVVKADPKRRVLPWDDYQLTDEALAAEWEARQAARAGKPKPRIHRKRSEQTLNHPFTENELRELGEDLADKIAERDRLKAEVLEVQNELNPEIKKLEKSAVEIAKLMKHGSELRSVEVEETIDYDAGFVTTVRLDTGEEIGTRPLRNDERQRLMF